MEEDKKNIKFRIADCTIVLKFDPNNKKNSKNAVLSLLRQDFLHRIINEDRENKDYFK